MIESYKKREAAIRRKLIQNRHFVLDSFEVKSIIGEYGLVMKQICQVKEELELMLSVAKSFRNEKSKQLLDEEYGAGSAEYFAQAIEMFYL